MAKLTITSLMLVIIFNVTIAKANNADPPPRLVAYRDTYILFAKYNPNPPALADYSTRLASELSTDEQVIDKLESEFQISGKLILKSTLFNNRDYLSIAYTQQSFWQVYNKPVSAPFRDTNYEPELIYTWLPNDKSIVNNRWQLKAVSLGFSHQANGSQDELSRSWERVYAQFDAAYNNFQLSFKPWLPVGPETNQGEEFTDYYGYGELSMAYLFGEPTCPNKVSVMGRNNLKSNNKGAFDLRLSYCVSQSFSLYAKYFNGYGESLLDYNFHNQSFGLGLSLNRIPASDDLIQNHEIWQYAGMSLFRDNYILPVKYNPSPSIPDLKGGLSGEQPENMEVEFQISFGIMLPFKLFTDNDNINIAYSQQTFWQPYKRSGDSIRETNYEPEIFYQWNQPDNDLSQTAWSPSWVRLGLVHESNGQAQLRSRSWNRIYTEFNFDLGEPLDIGKLNLAIKPWYRFKEEAEDDDNPNMEDYYGYGELSVDLEFSKYHRLNLLARNNLKRDNKGAIDVRWSYPISSELSIYLKYFNGYGESLIDYNKHNQSLGLGFAINH
ncbi:MULTISPECIES: phospholipase A [unclassified Agarivorans]|uniref:phospholipase A n=1 Tax=unclassified Agarivorans TaxID=2636026 RepID=UPI003D7C9B53